MQKLAVASSGNSLANNSEREPIPGFNTWCLVGILSPCCRITPFKLLLCMYTYILESFYSSFTWLFQKAFTVYYPSPCFPSTLSSHSLPHLILHDPLFLLPPLYHCILCFFLRKILFPPWFLTCFLISMVIPDETHISKEPKLISIYERKHSVIFLSESGLQVNGSRNIIQIMKF